MTRTKKNRRVVDAAKAEQAKEKIVEAASVSAGAAGSDADAVTYDIPVELKILPHVHEMGREEIMRAFKVKPRKDGRLIYNVEARHFPRDGSADPKTGAVFPRLLGDLKRLVYAIIAAAKLSEEYDFRFHQVLYEKNGDLGPYLEENDWYDRKLANPGNRYFYRLSVWSEAQWVSEWTKAVDGRHALLDAHRRLAGKEELPKTIDDLESALRFVRSRLLSEKGTLSYYPSDEPMPHILPHMLSCVFATDKDSEQLGLMGMGGKISGTSAYLIVNDATSAGLGGGAVYLLPGHSTYKLHALLRTFVYVDCAHPDSRFLLRGALELGRGFIPTKLSDIESHSLVVAVTVVD